MKVLGWIGNDDLAPSQVVHGILFERCCESLRGRWKTTRGLVPPEATQRIMKCITRGLAHIHSLFVAHLDVTPANILLQWNVDGLCAKLSDFGTSVLLQNVSAIGCTRQNMKCTWTYRAPEISLGLPFGFAADVWSAGAIAREMFTGRNLYELLDSEKDDPSQLDYARIMCGSYRDRLAKH